MTAPFEPRRYPEERRLATVLFADVQGFTTLSDQMDFEDVGDLMREVWELVDRAIDAHGGYIDKHIGDAVMAVWGAPHASEDDAERAVSAALTLQDSLRQFAIKSTREGANQLRMRVGINTGQVLAGYVGARGEYTVLGDTVNIASRLETTAEPGTVVISDSTYRLVRGLFRVRQLPPMILKGKHQPIGAFLVEGKIEQPSLVRYRSRGGLETHMVGREAEMEQLHHLYAAAMQNQSIGLAMVRGDAGMGKSRLLMEFTSQLEAREPALQLLSTRGLAQASRSPYFVWKSLWHLRFGINENDEAALAREKFVRGMQTIWGHQLGTVSAVEAAHVVGALTGLDWPDSPYLAKLRDDPEDLVDRAFELTRAILRRVAANGPAVLSIDDLHWSDGGSLDLLEYILESPDEFPLLIVTAMRPGILRSRRALRSAGTIVSLQPLALTPALVADAYPAIAALPEAVRAEIARASEGNPYYMEEIVKNMMQTTSAGTAPLGGGESAVPMPDSLHATLQARLDALSPEARAVALLASVVGRVFWVGAVMSAAAAQQATGTGLLRPPGAAPAYEGAVMQGLSELVRAELAFPRAGSMLFGEQEYIFKHSILRDVAYSLIPHKHRRQYHVAVARWLQRYGTADFAATVGEHLEQAGVFIEAAENFEVAAAHARKCGAIGEAQWLENHANEIRNFPAGTRPLGRTGPLPNLS